jgi:hypothetical protein
VKYDVEDFSSPLPGDVFFTVMGQPAKAGVKIGQMLIGDDSRMQHTGIAIKNNQLMEVRPPAARIVDINPSKDSYWFRLPLSDYQRDTIDYIARSQLERGLVKYSWACYPNLAVQHWGWEIRNLDEYIQKTSRRICSQSVDELLTVSGYQVFHDGRKFGDVSTGDLHWRLAMTNDVKVFRIDGKEGWNWDE